MALAVQALRTLLDAVRQGFELVNVLIVMVGEASVAEEPLSVSDNKACGESGAGLEVMQVRHVRHAHWYLQFP